MRIQDIPNGSIDRVGFTILRKFHCWQLVAGIGFDREYENNDWDWDIEYFITANLTGLNSAMNSVQNSVLREAGSLGSNFKF